MSKGGQKGKETTLKQSSAQELKHGRLESIDNAIRNTHNTEEETKPKSVRRLSRSSTIRAGRTIGEKREHLETRNERAAARKKDKHKNTRRIVIVTLGFVALIAILVVLAITFFGEHNDDNLPISPAEDINITYEPTIEIIDEDASATGGKITARMRQYIGQAEADFKELGYTPTRVILPAGAIREVDFYLEGYPGFIKLIIDRPTAVSVEDADRMLRYLAEQGITEFQYIDVRIDKQAYWR